MPAASQADRNADKNLAYSFPCESEFIADGLQTASAMAIESVVACRDSSVAAFSEQTSQFSFQD
jgi:hypothetical protein